MKSTCHAGDRSMKPCIGFKNGEEAFYHNFTVRGYPLELRHNGGTCILPGWPDGERIALLDASDNEIQRFSTASVYK